MNGLAHGFFLALVTIDLVSLYFGRIMLINDKPRVTAGCVIALALLGGLRC